MGSAWTGYLVFNALLFGAFQAPSVGAASIPRQQLLAFARLSALAPGEVRDVSLAVPRDALALVDEAGVLRVQAGTWRLWLGGGPPDAAAFGGGSVLEGTLTVM